jgi:hypothetical protein
MEITVEAGSPILGGLTSRTWGCWEKPDHLFCRCVPPEAEHSSGTCDGKEWNDLLYGHK